MKEDRRTRKTKALIRETLLSLLEKKRFESITITELTKAADLDRKTFYLHYQCMEDVLEEILAEASVTAQSLISPDGEFNIKEYFHGLTGIMTGNMKFFSLISTTSVYSRFLEECKDILKQSLYKAKHENTSLGDDKFEVYTEYISAGIMVIYTDWLKQGQKIPIEVLEEFAMDAVHHAWKEIIE